MPCLELATLPARKHRSTDGGDHTAVVVHIDSSRSDIRTNYTRDKCAALASTIMAAMLVVSTPPRAAGETETSGNAAQREAGAA
jgi:hypothetical protein